MSVGIGPCCCCDRAARVVTNVNICREHYYLELALTSFPPSQAGQFLQLRCADASHSRPSVREWPESGFPALSDEAVADASAYLRRPFSIADRRDGPDGRTYLLVVHRAIGPGTRWLEQLDVDDSVSITGPLGRGFTLPQPEQWVVMLGGGVGIPPLLYLARTLAERGHARCLAIFGARAAELLPVALRHAPPTTADPTVCVEFPHGGAVPALVTTDDGSLGIRGRVTDGLLAWLERHAVEPKRLRVVACGPEPMLRAVAAVTRDLNLPCELCIERMMGCGFGTCQSCVTRVVDHSRPCGWRYALTCVEGPVFERDVLLDYAA